ncbi:MAG: hypothetical protein J4F48_10320, partial [Nitrospinae bacterium]|nr:hypothetical protein [Nitrospinota bacterium]
MSRVFPDTNSGLESNASKARRVDSTISSRLNPDIERIIRLGLMRRPLSRAAQAREGEGQGEKRCDDA